MHKHPFIETRYRKVALLLISCLAVCLYAVLLHLYGDIALPVALTDSALSLSLLLAFGFFFWFIVDVIRIPQAGFVLSAGVLILWLGGCFIIQLADYPLDERFVSRFLFLLPLRFCFGTLMWTGLMQWYRIVRLNRWKTDQLLAESIQAEPEYFIDRIAVKNGSRIHVIHIRNLIHVQACGDYVMLFTREGQFLKEQTMKSLEHQLPGNFARIHRSFIVNVEEIDRVELYAKESYHVMLKNGTTLRASVSGYKLLKELLAL